MDGIIVSRLCSGVRFASNFGSSVSCNAFLELLAMAVLVKGFAQGVYWTFKPHRASNFLAL